MRIANPIELEAKKTYRKYEIVIVYSLHIEVVDGKQKLGRKAQKIEPCGKCPDGQ